MFTLRQSTSEALSEERRATARPNLRSMAPVIDPTNCAPWPLAAGELTENATFRELGHRGPRRRLNTMEQHLNRTIELHDTECLATAVDDQGSGSILLDAYVHRTVGEPGISPGEGGVQRIRMRFSAMTILGES